MIRGNIWSVEKKEKEENMWRKKYLISRGDEKRRRNRGKYLKKGIFWAVKEEKNVELKGEKHLEKEIEQMYTWICVFRLDAFYTFVCNRTTD